MLRWEMARGSRGGGGSLTTALCVRLLGQNAMQCARAALLPIQPPSPPARSAGILFLPLKKNHCCGAAGILMSQRCLLFTLLLHQCWKAGLIGLAWSWNGRALMRGSLETKRATPSHWFYRFWRTSRFSVVNIYQKVYPVYFLDSVYNVGGWF